MKISQLRKRSNQFVKSLPKVISEVVDNNEQLLNLNREQLKGSKLATDQKIRPPYTNPYRDWKSKNFPQSYGNGDVNLFLKGNLYREMFVKSTGLEYDMGSKVEYSKYHEQRYGKVYGIAPSNHRKAQSITSKLIADEYRRKVLT